MNIKENCTALAGFKDDVENIKPHQENAEIWYLFFCSVSVQKSKKINLKKKDEQCNSRKKLGSKRKIPRSD